MTALSIIKKLIPQTLKDVYKNTIKQDKLENLVSEKLPDCICIDVGASYFPHGKWRLFLKSQNTRWVAVEPNKKNLGYIDSWGWPAKVRAVTTGLSREKGVNTLYITNVDSGSSLLEPKIPEGMSHRIKDNGMEYFFPVQTTEINTISLAEVIAMEDSAIPIPIFVKLDTQGTELSILQGAESLLKNKNILGIEMESTLLAQPIMQGSGKLWEACEYLECLGFELLDIDPIRATTNYDIKSPKGKRYLNECDAIFVLRRDIVKTLPVDYRMALFGFYISNALFEEALSILIDDVGIQENIITQDVSLEDLKQLLIKKA